MQLLLVFVAVIVVRIAVAAGLRKSTVTASCAAVIFCVPVCYLFFLPGIAQQHHHCFCFVRCIFCACASTYTTAMALLRNFCTRCAVQTINLFHNKSMQQ
jgi:hypothetical protein